jgi:hypothetical protein
MYIMAMPLQVHVVVQPHFTKAALYLLPLPDLR